MTFWTNDSAKVKYAKEYFSSLNAMASKIIEEENKIAKSFSKDKWEKFSVADKENIINNRIILPSVAKRYKLYKHENLPEHCHKVFPKLILTTGQRTVSSLEDDTHQNSWKDEHSDPFSWETKSQMNISLPPPCSKPNGKKRSKNHELVSNDVSSKPFDTTSPVEKVKSHKNSKAANQSSKSSSKAVDLDGSIFSYNALKPLQSNEEKNASSNEATQSLVHLKQSLKTTEPVLDNSNAMQSTESFYKLPKKEVKRRPESKKTKSSSSRINPRSSLTLDGGSTSSCDGSGAIRNLEIAMKEENSKPVQLKSTNAEQAKKNVIDNDVKLEINTNKKESLLDSDDDFEKFLHTDDSFSLDLDGEKAPDEDAQKSGFDFLDNW